MYSGSSLRDPQYGGLNESLRTGRTRQFFPQVCCGAKVAHGQVRRAKSGFRGGVLATTTQSADPLCSEFECVRLYSTIPKVYYVIDTWRILGPAPMIRNPVQPTIPHGALPKSQAQRKREYPDAKEDSKTGVTVALNGSSICGQ